MGVYRLRTGLCPNFRNWFSTCPMMDLGFVCPRFTWVRGRVKERGLRLVETIKLARNPWCQNKKEKRGSLRGIGAESFKERKKFRSQLLKQSKNYLSSQFNVFNCNSRKEKNLHLLDSQRTRVRPDLNGENSARKGKLAKQINDSSSKPKELVKLLHSLMGSSRRQPSYCDA
ncbi:hypothetical protein M9H77_23592 [Catharanthus roseus]|uniref:Uncharacterized protein n=1 Tax=Catharanthus roseus TaxID=4058 RepID=A0ACC0ATP5_CATRO|nr:hypothetical protein M9H77_23592 [Catharanthus roseus]